MIKPIIGQEALCPDGLGRVEAYRFECPDNYIQVQTYFYNRSCRWSPDNVQLVKIDLQVVTEEEVNDLEDQNFGYGPRKND
jgi:hypothetical protein